MQSSDGTLHLLPALPNAWPIGRVQGLRARGGFEIADMQWKNGRLIKVLVKSRLGGVLHLRVPNALKQLDGKRLALARVKNANPFYQVDEVLPAVISQKATITPPTLKETIVYEIPTDSGAIYTLVAE
jgi:alpha-L-fucosidase 2